MSVSSHAFYSDEANVETLYNRIRPSPEQLAFLQEKWRHVAEHLEEAFRSYNPSTWLQGSYKYGTLVRPVNSDEEYDVDLGFYISPNPMLMHSITNASAYKGSVRASLAGFVTTDQDAKGLVSPKERCERVEFRKQFHVDVPCYDYAATGDKRTLATQTKGWEESDPKKLYVWFRNLGPSKYRAALRRYVCYFKIAIGVAYQGSNITRPSSILLTVLAADSFATLTTDQLTLDEDDRFGLMLGNILKRVRTDTAVPNPVDNAENLNRLSSGENGVFIRHLEALQASSRSALSTQHPYYSAVLWGDIFGHFFPLPDNAKLSLRESFSKLATIVPEIGIEVRSIRTGNSIGSFRNAVPSVDKGCALLFSISNAASIPADATVEWTVRNEGREASDVNDLGHRSPGGRMMSGSETTRYAGRHYMDCVVKRNGNVYAARRIPVSVTNRTTTR